MIPLLFALASPGHAIECGALRPLYARVAVSGSPGEARRARQALAACDQPGSPPPLPRSEPDKDCSSTQARIDELVSLGGDPTPFQGLVLNCDPVTPASSWRFQTATLTSSFGWRFHPILKRDKLHTGIDLDADPGDRVPALAAGVVTRAERAGGYGLLVEVDHGGGYRTRYAHNSRLLVHPGDTVAAGQVLAEAGSTGLSTGVHVHLEVRRDDEPVDPAPFVRNPGLLTW